jgi:hypothetical protein
MKHAWFQLFVVVCVLTSCACAEVPPEKSVPCFPGAYYRKAVSSMDTWSGIEGVITIPSFTPDPDRVNPDTGRALDNPSVYMGGRAGDTEIDAGLSWEVIKEEDGTVSKAGKAFRPFWRNNGWHSGPAKPEFYYYPGDQVRIRIESLETNKLTMFIELLSRAERTAQTAAKPVSADSLSTSASGVTSSTSEKKVIATGSLPSPGEKSQGNDFSATAPDAVTSLTVTFDAPGFGPDRVQQFKRVNAIDQSGNEGKPVQPTKARVTDATWTEVYLLRGRMRVPFSRDRYTDMRCPTPMNFTVFAFNDCAERISIRGSAK